MIDAPPGGLGHVERVDVVGDVDERGAARFGKQLTLQRAREMVFQAEVGREGNYRHKFVYN